MLTPYPYQEDAIQSIFDYYLAGTNGMGNPVIAMPTATGKSLVIAEFIHRTFKQWPLQRVIVATHVKELIKQNASKLLGQWPTAPMGIYSSGLNQCDTMHPIIYGGVASMVKCPERFGHRDLFLVDEAHLIGPDDETMYQKLITALRVINPHMKVIGFTATPWRSGYGLITDGKLFDDFCYNICNMESYNKLIQDGYLALLIPKKTGIELDVTGVGTANGDYAKNELQAAVDKHDVTYQACLESVQQGADRISWLCFASGIKHAEHITECLQTMGIDAAYVHSKMPQDLADENIQEFREGKIRCLVNYGKLTTGFDHPPIDLIIMLRPTQSAVLWVQMLGRGGRPSVATRKENCLVLDFAKNTARLGPVNDPIIPHKRVKGQQPGVAPIKICPKCGTYNHARAPICIGCGAKFDMSPKLYKEASTDELVRFEPESIVDWVPVQQVIYNMHQKKGSPPMIKVTYICGLRMHNEWLCFDHTGFAKKKAAEWWLKHYGGTIPQSTDEALKSIGKLPWPKKIRIWHNKKYPEVMGFEF